MKKRLLSLTDTFVIIFTILLFTIALFVKGITHDLLLEAGILLVSVKLIMMSYKISIINSLIQKDMEEIKKMLQENQCKQKDLTPKTPKES